MSLKLKPSGLLRFYWVNVNFVGILSLSFSVALGILISSFVNLKSSFINHKDWPFWVCSVSRLLNCLIEYSQCININIYAITQRVIKVVNSLRPSDAYICVSKQTIIGSDNGLSSGWCHVNGNFSNKFQWNLNWNLYILIHDRKCLWNGCHFVLAAMRYQATNHWWEVLLWCYMVLLSHSDLTHCGLVTSYGDRDLGQHWLR